MWETKPEDVLSKMVEDIGHKVLPTTHVETQYVPFFHGNRHRCSNTNEASDEAHARKKDKTHVEQSMRASILDEEFP